MESLQLELMAQWEQGSTELKALICKGRLGLPVYWHEVDACLARQHAAIEGLKWLAQRTEGITILNRAAGLIEVF